MFHDQVLRKAVDARCDDADGVALASDRENPQAPAVCGRAHAIGIFVVDVDHRAAARREQRLEQAELGIEIGFQAAVVIEMVAADVGEGAHPHAHTVKAALIQSMRGGFHGDVGDAVGGKAFERAMQLDGIWRGQRPIGGAARRHHAERADARGAPAELRPDLSGECHDRGLAARAGDRDDGSRLARR